jgi:hypothetical protein
MVEMINELSSKIESKINAIEDRFQSSAILPKQSIPLPVELNHTPNPQSNTLNEEKKKKESTRYTPLNLEFKTKVKETWNKLSDEQLNKMHIKEGKIYYKNGIKYQEMNDDLYCKICK